MKSLPFSIFKAIGLNFLSRQYGIAITICANFQTPNFKGSACAGLQAFDLKCPFEAFGGQIKQWPLAGEFSEFEYSPKIRQIFVTRAWRIWRVLSKFL